MSEEQKAALDIVRHELAYRRDKQWKIFSWTATLLLAAIAGVITLVGKKEFLFWWPQRITMAIALVVIGAYACLWIHENIEFEKRSRTLLLERLKHEGLASAIPDPASVPSFGYLATIILLMIAAVSTVLCAPMWTMDPGQPSCAANGSQPIRSKTNQTSPAAGSRR